ncbi:MAG: hypothetical protein FJW35_15340 [Acidobacteria bacterium]|nr:hypothetical protein [Acidobacteriota bacterium]
MNMGIHACGLLMAVLWTVVPPGFAVAQETAQPGPAQWSRAEKEQFLLKAKIVRQVDAGRGITGTTRATLKSERGTHDAHVQTINEYKQMFQSPMGTEINFKDTYKFNIASYILDQILQINMIPITVERKVQGRTASLTWWVDDVLMSELERKNGNVSPPDTDRWNCQMHVVRVFDQLIANTDRNLGNLLITRDWDIWMIDHGRAFRMHTDLREPKNLVRCDRALLAAMRRLDKQTLKSNLGKYLTGMEIDGLLARRDLIVKTFEQKAAQEGEAAVFYDFLTLRTSSDPKE